MRSAESAAAMILPSPFSHWGRTISRSAFGMLFSPVDAFVIGSIFAAGGAGDPVRIRFVPLDGGPQAVLQRDLGLPAQFFANERAIDGVAPVMAEAVRDVREQALGPVEDLEEQAQ